MQDLTTFANGLNQIFPDLSILVERVSNLYPELNLIPNWRGKSPLWRPVFTSARGAKKFTKARLNAMGPSPSEASFPFKRDYVHVQIDNELIDALQGEGSAPQTEAEVRTEAALLEHALTLKLELIRGGGMHRAKFVSGTTTATATLSNPEDAVFILPDMMLQHTASANDGSASTASDADLLDSGATVRVGKVDAENGTVTTYNGLAWNDITNWPGVSDTDYVFRDGDYADGFVGFDGWIPSTVPGGSDSFHGINRSVAPAMLSGMRRACAGELVDAIFDTIALSQRNKALINGSVVVMCDAYAAKLQKAFQSQVRFNSGAKAEFGSAGFTISTPWGAVKVVAETGWNPNSFLVGPLGKVDLYSRAATVPEWEQRDGGVWHRSYTADAIEAYLQSKLAMVVSEPRHFIRGNFS